VSATAAADHLNPRSSTKCISCIHSSPGAIQPVVGNAPTFRTSRHWECSSHKRTVRTQVSAHAPSSCSGPVAQLRPRMSIGKGSRIAPQQRYLNPCQHGCRLFPMGARHHQGPSLAGRAEGASRCPAEPAFWVLIRQHVLRSVSTSSRSTSRRSIPPACLRNDAFIASKSMCPGGQLRCGPDRARHISGADRPVLNSSATLPGQFPQPGLIAKARSVQAVLHPARSRPPRKMSV